MRSVRRCAVLRLDDAAPVPMHVIVINWTVDDLWHNVGLRWTRRIYRRHVRTLFDADHTRHCHVASTGCVQDGRPSYGHVRNHYIQVSRRPEAPPGRKPGLGGIKTTNGRYRKCRVGRWCEQIPRQKGSVNLGPPITKFPPNPASKSVERFKQGARMWQTDDRQTEK